MVTKAVKPGFAHRLRRKSRCLGVRLSFLMAGVFAIGPQLLQIWPMVPPELKKALPPGTEHWVAAAGFIIIMMGRLFQHEDHSSTTNEGETQPESTRT